MAKSKEDLLQEAEDLQALGPIVPEGQTEPAAPESSGQTITGVQPLEDKDIPESGR